MELFPGIYKADEGSLYRAAKHLVGAREDLAGALQSEAMGTTQGWGPWKRFGFDSANPFPGTLVLARDSVYRCPGLNVPFLIPTEKQGGRVASPYSAQTLMFDTLNPAFKPSEFGRIPKEGLIGVFGISGERTREYEGFRLRSFASGEDPGVVISSTVIEWRQNDGRNTLTLGRAVRKGSDPTNPAQVLREAYTFEQACPDAIYSILGGEKSIVIHITEGAETLEATYDAEGAIREKRRPDTLTRDVPDEIASVAELLGHYVEDIGEEHDVLIGLNQ